MRESREWFGARGSCLHPAPERRLLFSGDLAGAEDSCGVRIDQDLDHHGWMKGLVAWATLSVACVKCVQVQAVDGVADEVGQVALG